MEGLPCKTWWIFIILASLWCNKDTADLVSSITSTLKFPHCGIVLHCSHSDCFWAYRVKGLLLSLAVIPNLLPEGQFLQALLCWPQVIHTYLLSWHDRQLYCRWPTLLHIKRVLSLFLWKLEASYYLSVLSICLSYLSVCPVDLSATSSYWCY